MEVVSEISCRACLQVCENEAVNVMDVAEVFYEFTGYKLHVNDVPQKICDYCLQQLEFIQEFKRTCEKTEDILSSIRMDMTKEDENVQQDYETVMEFKEDEDDAERYDLTQGPIEIDASEELINFLHNQGPPPKRSRTVIVPIKKHISPKKTEKGQTDHNKNRPIRKVVQPVRYRVSKEGIDFQWKYDMIQDFLDEKGSLPSDFELFVINFPKTKKDPKHLPANQDKTIYDGSTMIVCDFCNLNFKFKKNLMLHMKKCPKYPKDPPQIICEKCKMDFLSQNLLKSHFETSKCGSDDIRSYKNGLKCTFCDYKVPNNRACEYIKTHMKLAKTNVHKALFKCTCGLEFQCLDLVREHNEKSKCNRRALLTRLQCDYCQFNCTLSLNMAIHCEQMHKNIKAEICRCGVKFFCNDLKLEHIVFRCSKAPPNVLIPFESIFGDALQSRSPDDEDPEYSVDYQCLEKFIEERDGVPTAFESFVLSYEDKKMTKRPINEDTTLYEDNYKFQCDFCASSFCNITGLRVHFKKCPKATILKNENCPNAACKVELPSKNMLKYHMEISKCGPIGLKNGLSCTHCEYVADITHAAESIRTHTNSKKLQCSQKPTFKCICGESTATIDTLRVHNAKDRCTNLPLVRSLQCNYCDFSCCLEANMRYHNIKMHHDKIPFKCDCDQVMYCDDLRLQHIIFRCDISTQSCYLPFQFLFGPCPLLIDTTIEEIVPGTEEIKSKKQRLPIKRAKARVVCELCGKDMAINRLPEHMNAVHTTLEDRIRYQCDLCGRAYNEKVNLQKHMLKKHLNQLNYPCKYCDRIFQEWSTRYYHTKKNHTFDLPYVCDVCAKRFASASQLTYHAATHSEVRKFPCPECGNLYRSIKELGIHKRNIHSTRMYSCQVCQKEFKNLKLLRQHKKSHEPNSYICPVCPMSFSVSHTLRGHVSKKHPTYPMPPVGTQLRNVDINEYNRVEWSQ